MRYLTNDLDAAGIPTFAESDDKLSPYTGPAARSWDFVADPDHPYGADMIVREVTTPHGIFRACVRQDYEYPDAPDFEMGCPVFRLERDGRLADKPELGEDSWREDGLDDITIGGAVYHFTERTRDPLEVTDRWLRIFHGGSLKVISSHNAESDYITYDTRAMRAYWGQTGEMLETSDPEAEEWQAYLDGEVYVVSVERAVEWDEDGEPTWETLDDYPVHGFYGDYAYQAAEDELHGSIRYVAGQMLPLGGE